jgi:hypothetical protein
MLTISDKVNVIHVPRELEPRSALALRVVLITDLWKKRAYGITTATMAAAVAGVSVPLIDAARIVLQSGDEALRAQVLNGQLSLTCAAAKARRRVRLIQSFKAASLTDRAALGRAVGADELFDSVISPILIAAE